MAKKKGEKEEKGAGGPPADPEMDERKRLRSLAVSRKLLSRVPAKPSAPLPPSMAVVKLQGRDIAKRGQRKSRYLFSFPGLIAPLSGGRVGELADLGTKNPILYLEFPQGRMKLFGTHVYPKNKYLTLQLTKSSKGVVVEDIFESMIVFSDAWWIGRKEENPQEEQLELPKFNEAKDSVDYSFKGGAGASVEDQLGGNNLVTDNRELLTPGNEIVDDMLDDCDSKPQQNVTITESTPVRQSARTAGKKLSYLESCSGDDSTSNDAEVPEMMEEKNEDPFTTSSNVASESELVKKNNSLKAKMKQSVLSSTANNEDISVKKGPLVQATLSTFFEQAAIKKSKRKANSSPGPKGPVSKRQSTSKQSTDQLQVKDSSNHSKSSGNKRGSQKATPNKAKVLDDVEEILSESQDDSDEDWAA